MSDTGVDRKLLHAWLSARSIARGLPAPAADHGGYRVDTNSADEVKRWVFPRAAAGLVALAHSINQPRHFLKLCGEAEDLLSMLPDRWQLHSSNYFMQASGPPVGRPIPEGYMTETDRSGEVVEVVVKSPSGIIAARGYAAETEDAFVYDRIVTKPEHRRKGLGSAVIVALHRAKQSSATPELLVATEDGRALYETLGWRIISPYSTASILDAECPVSGSASISP